MRKYELKIKDLNGVWHTADLGNDLPAMNYQVNDIAELKNSQADYSRQLKLPKSAVNRKIFGYSDIFESVTNVPFRRLDCRLFLNDIYVAGIGSYLILDRVSEHFEVQILAGNANIFELMQNGNMSDIDLGFYQLGSVTFGDYYQTNANYCLPEATFVKGGDVELTPARRYPFAFLMNAVNKTLTKYGYSLVHNLGANVNNLAVSVSTFNVGNVPFVSRLYFKDKPASYGEIKIFAQGQQGGVVTLRGVQYALPGLTVVTHWYTRYTARYDMTLNMKIDLYRYRYYTGLSSFNVKKFDAANNLIETYMSGSYGNYYYTVIIELLTGEYIEVDAKKDDVSYESKPVTVYPFAPYIVIDVAFTSVSVNNYTKVQTGDNLYISPNIGFEKQLDLFKTFVQLFGMTVFTDAIEKKIYAFTLEKIYENKSIAKDWSRKLHDKNHSFDFGLKNYAQINYIRLLDNADDVATDSVSFTIDDETLENTKDLFTIDFEAGIDNLIGNAHTEAKKVANIPIERVDGAEVSVEGCKNHLVIITQTEGSSLKYYANHQRLSSFINYYKRLYDNILVRSKMIEVEFYLTEKDIEEYRSVKNGMPGCFIPVWVEKFGAYFYINKIKNFISGKLTKVELIRL